MEFRLLDGDFVAFCEQLYRAAKRVLRRKSDRELFATLADDEGVVDFISQSESWGLLSVDRDDFIGRVLKVRLNH